MEIGRFLKPVLFKSQENDWSNILEPKKQNPSLKSSDQIQTDCRLKLQLREYKSQHQLVPYNIDQTTQKVQLSIQLILKLNVEKTTIVRVWFSYLYLQLAKRCTEGRKRLKIRNKKAAKCTNTSIFPEFKQIRSPLLRQPCLLRNQIKLLLTNSIQL